MKRYLHSFSLLLSGLFFITIGFLFFNQNLYLFRFIQLIIALGFILYGVSHFLSIFSRKRKPLISFIRFLFSWAYAIYIYVNPFRFFIIVPYLFSFWSAITSLIQFINFIYVYHENKLKHRYFILLDAISNLLFALLLISDPLEHFFIITYLVGFYSLFFGSTEIIKAINSYYMEKHHREPLNRVAIPLPIFFAAFIPNIIIKRINNLFEKDQSIINKKNSKEVDMEILIHLKDSGFESFGHCDISYQGTIFSYGCHNPHSRKLFGALGDGVLILADRDAFIQHAVENEKSTIIQYGLSLSPKQKKIVDKRVLELLSYSDPFYSDAELYYLTHNEDDPEIKDYLSRVFRHTKAKSFRFTEGKFKTYFVFTTNCVQVADYFLSMKEINLVNVSGLITPGTYVEFLNREMDANNPLIVERNIYSPQTKKK